MEEQAYAKSFWQELAQEEEKLRQETGRVGWLCSYTPVEIISACGLRPYRFYGQEGRAPHGDLFLHSSLCFLVRCCLERVLKSGEAGLEGMVLVNSCTAMTHLHHTLESYTSLPFTYLLDLPRNNSEPARKFYAQQLRKLHRALSEYSGTQSAEAELWQQIYFFRENRIRLQQLCSGLNSRVTVNGGEMLRLLKAFTVFPPHRLQQILNLAARMFLTEKAPPSGPRIFITGSPAPESLLESISELGGVLALDDLCTGRRVLQFCAEPEAGEDPYSYLSRLYLGRVPCPRMQWAAETLEQIDNRLNNEHIDGVIFFYLKFCEPWYYYGQLLKEKIKEIPVLVLEGECSGVTGQMRTRISAFLEMIG